MGNTLIYYIKNNRKISLVQFLMKQRVALLQTFCILVLICFCAQAQQSDPSLNHAIDKTKTRKSVAIKFQRPKPTTWGYDTYFSFPVQFSSENTSIQMEISTKTSAIWIKSEFYSELKGAPYNCSESKSCLGEAGNFEFLRGVPTYVKQARGMLIKEQVSFGGASLPNLGVFMTDCLYDFSDEYDMRFHSAVLGLDFTRTHPDVPTIFETLKTEGLVEEAIISISLMNGYEGELIFGGYPANKTKADFKFAPSVGRSTVAINGIGYNKPDGGTEAILDFQNPFISLPRSTGSYDKIHDIIKERGLAAPYPGPKTVPQVHPDGIRAVKCKAIDVLHDLVVEFEGFTLRIPASIYIVRTKGFFYKREEESSEEGCFLAVDLAESSTMVFGRPFFKAYDVTFDSETNSVGFSQKYVPDPEPFKNFTPLAILTMSLASLVLLEFCFFSWAKNFRKPDMKVRWEGLRPEESFSSEVLGEPIAIGEPVQILPYQTNYVNVQSDEKIGDLTK